MKSIILFLFLASTSLAQPVDEPEFPPQSGLNQPGFVGGPDSLPPWLRPNGPGSQGQEEHPEDGENEDTVVTTMLEGPEERPGLPWIRRYPYGESVQPGFVGGPDSLPPWLRPNGPGSQGQEEHPEDGENEDTVMPTSLEGPEERPGLPWVRNYPYGGSVQPGFVGGPDSLPPWLRPNGLGFVGGPDSFPPWLRPNGLGFVGGPDSLPPWLRPNGPGSQGQEEHPEDGENEDTVTPTSLEGPEERSGLPWVRNYPYGRSVQPGFVGGPDSLPPWLRPNGPGSQGQEEHPEDGENEDTVMTTILEGPEERPGLPWIRRYPSGRSVQGFHG